MSSTPRRVPERSENRDASYVRWCSYRLQQMETRLIHAGILSISSLPHPVDHFDAVREVPGLLMIESVNVKIPTCAERIAYENPRTQFVLDL